MAPGSSQTTLLVRIYAALLQTALELDGAPTKLGPLLDPRRVLQQPPRARRRPHAGAGRRRRPDRADRRATTSPRDSIDQRIELTSREPSSTIPEAPQATWRSDYPDPDALDVILATNMISVGVDIDRLGLMVVMGQPQATSEYIQATSRVGRTQPGPRRHAVQRRTLARPLALRGFLGYHRALYRQVESTSVTPFSPRARDRGLHAVVVALARMLDSDLRPNNGAGDEVARSTSELDAAQRAVLDRVERRGRQTRSPRPRTQTRRAGRRMARASRREPGSRRSASSATPRTPARSTRRRRGRPSRRTCRRCGACVTSIAPPTSTRSDLRWRGRRRAQSGGAS